MGQYSNCNMSNTDDIRFLHYPIVPMPDMAIRPVEDACSGLVGMDVRIDTTSRPVISIGTWVLDNGSTYSMWTLAPVLASSNIRIAHNRRDDVNMALDCMLSDVCKIGECDIGKCVWSEQASSPQAMGSLSAHMYSWMLDNNMATDINVMVSCNLSGSVLTMTEVMSDLSINHYCIRRPALDAMLTVARALDISVTDETGRTSVTMRRHGGHDFTTLRISSKGRIQYNGSPRSVKYLYSSFRELIHRCMSTSSARSFISSLTPITDDGGEN